MTTNALQYGPTLHEVKVGTVTLRAVEEFYEDPLFGGHKTLCYRVLSIDDKGNVRQGWPCRTPTHAREKVDEIAKEVRAWHAAVERMRAKGMVKII